MATTTDASITRHPLLAEAAVDWDIEALVGDYAKAHPRTRTPFAVLLGAMLRDTPVKETISLLDERPEPNVATINTRNSTLYANVMRLLNAQGHALDAEADPTSGKLTRQRVTRQLRTSPRYWRGGGWKRLVTLSRSDDARIQVVPRQAPGTRDFAADPMPVDGVTRIPAGNTVRFELSARGFAYGYLFHGNEKGEVTLVSPSWFAPGPQLPRDLHPIVVPRPETTPIVAQRPGSVDTVIAILLRDEDPLDLENSGDPIRLSDDDVKGIEWKLRVLRDARASDVEVISATYHIIAPPP